MNDNQDDAAAFERIQAVAHEGTQRYGEEGFNTAVNALARSGVRQDVVREIVARPDAASLLMSGGREALLHEMSAGSTDAEEQYRKIRKHERAQFLESRGRTR